MPINNDGSTLRFHSVPCGLIVATALPASTLKALVISAAQVALANEEVVAVLGRGYDGCAYFCHMACRYSHAGSVLVLPDLEAIEIVANCPRALERLRFLPIRHGRSVAVCSIRQPGDPPVRLNP